MVFRVSLFAMRVVSPSVSHSCSRLKHPSSKCGRSFSSTSRRCGHYETLSVPHNATKAQIKSSFYQLSKLFHPDVAEDPKSREKFQAVSDAYAILGDDRKRREYDRSLKRPAPPPTPTPTTSPTPSSTTSRHRPARPHPHVWEVHRSGKYTYYRPPPGQQTSYTWSRTDPFTSPHVQRATGKSAMPGGAHPRPMEGKARPGPFAGMGTGAGKDAGTGSGSGTAGAPHQQRTETESDRVGRESSVFRVIQVIGIVMVIATIGNGFSVSASW
ncbi:hypothetical protein SERLA73DRAFT_69195 [Serpula lacrymans var. lacrymans S7.3]|uniref:J domain-containing protein n=1 Tax=Serpula lacrymans var. lacrymans (strain S7.3) TaxID=936435 RepID=F8PKH1_SERL3|nr:hypothetical protein SERLA73DRAFT_69195 [Serpula lacrymans var. lacrymans S7.3]